MCGIAGWVWFDGDPDELSRSVDAMTETMACRGPDARGVWLDRDVALGHRRLAVIDLPGGAQPMVAEFGSHRVAVTYSGEVYNFAELREQLLRLGQEFRTRSDTEVVLRGYLAWGIAVVERLNGMYALAIWDSRDRRLVLLRDRMGVKPLYYRRTPDGVLFGSEPKAILASGRVKPVVDAAGLVELLATTKAPGHAVWSDMAEVKPGTVVIVDSAGLREHTYWSLRALPHEHDLAATVRHVRELLEDIVARQLVADVPVRLLLSGGLDSSALTTLAARHLAGQGELAHSVAVDFAGRAEHFRPDEVHGETPDAPFAHQVAAHVGAEHTDVVLDDLALADPELRRTTVAARDLPTGRGDPDASLYLLCTQIRRHATVALSGEAADEVFGGYRWFHDPAARRADTFPWLGSARANGVLGAVDPGWADRLGLDDVLADRYADAVAEVPVLAGESADERRMRVFRHLHLTRMVRALLDGKDRISMATGLEVRVPYCDHRLVEYVFNVPWSYLTFDGREKSLLRAAVADLLPEPVLARKKSPFPRTRDPRYVALLQRQVAELRAGSPGWVVELFDRSTVDQAVSAPPDRLSSRHRVVLERILGLHTWVELRQPTLAL